MTKEIKIKCWEVEIKFLVRKDSHGAFSKKELLENVKNGIGGNDMNCIDDEDLEVVIKWKNLILNKKI